MSLERSFRDSSNNTIHIPSEQLLNPPLSSELHSGLLCGTLGSVSPDDWKFANKTNLRSNQASTCKKKWTLQRSEEVRIKGGGGCARG